MADGNNKQFRRRRFLSIVVGGAFLAVAVGVQGMLVTRRKPAVSREEVTAFTLGFARLTDDGSSLVCSMQILAAQQQNPALRAAIQHIQAELEAGSTLSKVMAEYPDMFDADYIAVIEQGEYHGTLEESLHTLAQR